MNTLTTLPEELVSKATKQIWASYQFKLPRVTQIRKYRDLYNGKVPPRLRVRYNVPIPIFAGMIDTLQADLDDALRIRGQEGDPGDYKALEKYNAAITQESTSQRPGAQWNSKFRLARQEMLITGRGIMKYTASSDGGFSSNLDVVPFEDFYFEPNGGQYLDAHLFTHQDKIWKLRADLEAEKGGVYDRKQVEKLLNESTGTEVKMSNLWNSHDFANRFMPLGLSPESNAYVGEPLYHFVESVLKHNGIDWYLLWEAYTGTWIRCEKLRDVNSAGYSPWFSFASHPDIKNFASKGFGDDLYPHAMAMSDLFNEDLENRRRRNSGSRAYDQDMVPNVGDLDQAQMARDRLVAIDTKGGSRRISEAIYEFQTPELTGTIDMLSYMEQLAGRNFGVNDLQQGAAQGASKAVGVTYAELGQINKRIGFESQPFIEAGQELGMRFFVGLKDHLKEPMAIKLLGESGFEWDELTRKDLDINRDFEIQVVSQSKENSTNELARAAKQEALERVANRQHINPDVNYRMIDEHDLREGGWTDAEIALILDPNNKTDQRTIAETSSAIQLLMQGKMPPVNYNATAYFMRRILDFVKTHQDNAKVEKNFSKFMEYIDQHAEIAKENEARRAANDVRTAQTPVAPAAQQPAPPVAAAPSPAAIPA